MINTDAIKSDMPVVCSENAQFAIVEQLEQTGIIKLKQDETGQHHYIPVSWVISTEEDKITIDRSADNARLEWSTVSPNYIVD